MMFKGKLTLGDIGVSFLFPEKLLFCTFASSFPTLYFTFILMLMMLMTVWMLFHVDNHDDNQEDDDDVFPTIASPSRPPSLEFSSSITCCIIMNDANFDYCVDGDDDDNDNQYDDNLSPQ